MPTALFKRNAKIIRGFSYAHPRIILKRADGTLVKSKLETNKKTTEKQSSFGTTNINIRVHPDVKNKTKHQVP
jgi:hypothetical protein